MKLLLLMIQFFTRIPISIRMEVNEKIFGKAIICLPIVGLIIGSINAAFYSNLLFFFPSPIAGVLVVLGNACLTGAFHVDGLADTCDGIFSGRNRERVLEIMKDSCIGTNGACAIAFDFMIRAACLATLSESHVMLALIVAPIISRTMITILMRSTYARANKGLGSLFIDNVTKKNVLLTFLIGSLLVMSVMFFAANDKGLLLGMMLMVFNLVIIFGYKKMILTEIGGMTGDTLGAGNEICEVAVVLMFVSLEKWAVL
ncbi:MAG: cobS [Massilibacillus sp.]|nr:cobS [Massilibacillus sp.]